METENTSPGSPTQIICDWGSTRLRAYLVDAEGRVCNSQSSEMGVKAIAAGGGSFHEELGNVMERFRVEPDFSVSISGMAGAKNGWIETDYCDTPADAGKFSQNFVGLPGFANSRLFGGLKHTRSDGSVDVMRGEEIQVFGLLEAYPEADLICLPGTHSKWVAVKEGAIVSFKTYMTGDLFQSLIQCSIFASQVGSEEFDRDGFLHGCELARSGKTLNDLFTLRTEYVFSKVSDRSFHSCLSGFLITNEIIAENLPSAATVHLCGTGSLIDLYALALQPFSMESVRTDSETATIRGHLKLTNP